MEFQILGPLAAHDDGRELALGRPKQRQLLAVLLLEANSVVSVDRLIEELWPEEPPASARHSVEVYVSRLRKVLGEDRLVTSPPGYCLRVAEGELDADRFEQLVAEGHKALAAGQPAHAADVLREATELWRGAALDDVRTGTLIGAAARLEDLRLSAHEDRIDANLSMSRQAELVPELEGLVARHPLRERLHGQLMLALYLCGRQAEALDAYKSARRMLRDTVGIEPSRALQDLQRAILKQSPKLDRLPTPRARGGLPIPVTSLVGRETELEALSAMLLRDDVRLVTLTGTGGIGKTRLALEAARRVSSSFLDGALFIDLAPVSEPEQVVPEIAAGLDVRESCGDSLVSAVKNHLRAKELLLVLDNFEHLLGAARLVSDVLSSAQHLTVLVTSRALLHVYGEHTLSVPPLGLPDSDSPHEAVELFNVRARAARLDFERSGDNADAVAAICVRLDGLPLAIELAAARVRALSPESLLARMESRLRLLTGGPVDAPERQQTLRGAIEWSYGLLDQRQKRLFSRLGVFAGAFPFEAAEAVCDADVDALTGLVDVSLVRRDVGGFRLLETIREFAYECLVASGELESMRERHAEYFLALAERAATELEGHAQGPSLERLHAALGDLRAALRYFAKRDGERAGRLAAALHIYWQIRGPISDGLDAMRLARRKGGQSPEVRARLAYAEGTLAAMHGSFREAGLRLQKSIAYARATGNTRILARSLAWLSWSDLGTGDLQRAERRAKEAEALNRADGDVRTRTMVATVVAHLASQREEYVKAQALYGEAHSLALLLGDTYYVASTHLNLSYVAILVGDRRAALADAAAASEIAHRLGDHRLGAGSLLNRAFAELLLGEPEQAEQPLRESLLLLENHRDSSWAPEAMTGVAAFAASRGNLRRAARLAGAVDSLRADSAVEPPRTDSLLEERFLKPAREELGEAFWDELRTAGRAVDPEDALRIGADSLGAPAERALQIA